MELSAFRVHLEKLRRGEVAHISVGPGDRRYFVGGWHRPVRNGHAAAVLAASGLTEQRTAYQVQLASACGYSRPVVESHIATLLSRGAGRLRYRGSNGARVQLGMTVMAHNGAALARVSHQQLSDRSQTLRRKLRLTTPKAKKINRRIN